MIDDDDDYFLNKNCLGDLQIPLLDLGVTNKTFPHSISKFTKLQLILLEILSK